MTETIIRRIWYAIIMWATLAYVKSNWYVHWWLTIILKFVMVYVGLFLSEMFPRNHKPYKDDYLSDLKK